MERYVIGKSARRKATMHRLPCANWQQSRAGSEFLCKRARSRYWTDSGATLLSPLTLIFIGLAFLAFVIVAVRSPSPPYSCSSPSSDAEVAGQWALADFPVVADIRAAVEQPEDGKEATSSSFP